MFPLRVYPYCTIKLRFNREQEQKRPKSCMKRCSCFFASRICRPSKTDANSLIFIHVNKNTAKTRRFSLNIFSPKPRVYKLYTLAATLYETGITICSSSFYPKDIGCILAHMSFAFSSCFVLFCCVFLLRCPPKKERRRSLSQPSFCWYSLFYSSFNKNIRAARTPFFAARNKPR